MITFPNKVYSEAEVIQLYEKSYSKWKDKNKTDGTPLSKTRTPRAQQPLFPPFTRKTPDGYYVALDGDILAGWAGWRAVDENLYLTAGSFTAPDYRGQRIQSKLWVKRNSMFAGKSVITITNKKEKGWVNFTSRYYPKVTIDKIPEKYRADVQEALDFYEERGKGPKIFYRGPTEDSAMQKAWSILKILR